MLPTRTRLDPAVLREIVRRLVADAQPEQKAEVSRLKDYLDPGRPADPHQEHSSSDLS